MRVKREALIIDAILNAGLMKVLHLLKFNGITQRFSRPISLRMESRQLCDAYRYSDNNNND